VFVCAIVRTEERIQQLSDSKRTAEKEVTLLRQLIHISPDHGMLHSKNGFRF